MANPRRLTIWSGGDPDGEPAKLTLSSALYSPPNKDRSAKLCQNCIMWIRNAEECWIHDAGVTATADSVCGYHVFGEPQEQPPPRVGMQPVLPELSGLEQVPGGTSCGSCRHYKPTAGEREGLCQALWDKDEHTVHPSVEGLGCCAAWESA